MSDLTENEVVERVKAHLTRSGWDVKHAAQFNQRGTDVYAQRARGDELFVEAKGSRRNSASEGARPHPPFGKGGVFTAVSSAIFKCLKYRTQHARARVAIAVPDVDHYKSYLDGDTIAELSRLDIEVWFVSGAQDRPRLRGWSAQWQKARS